MNTSAILSSKHDCSDEALIVIIDNQGKRFKTLEVSPYDNECNILKEEDLPKDHEKNFQKWCIRIVDIGENRLWLTGGHYSKESAITQMNRLLKYKNK